MITTQTPISNDLSNLGFRMAGFRDWPLGKSLQCISQAGYQSVELCLEHPEVDPGKLTAQDISRIKSTLEENHLRVGALSHCYQGDDFSEALEKQKGGLRLAQELGCRVLVLGTAASTADPDGHRTEEALAEILQTADGTGITVAVDPEPDTVFHGIFEFSMLASRMAGLPLGLNLNVGHAALTERDVCEVIQEWAPFIVHTHIGDVRRNEHKHLFPGEGHLDLRKLIAALREIGYQGDFTLDVSNCEDPPDKVAKQAIIKFREIIA